MSLLGFSGYRFYINRYWIAAILLVSALVLLYSAWLEWQDKPSLAMKQLSLLVTSVAVCLACYSMGYKALVYIFPISFIYFILFPWHRALMLAALFSLLAVWAGSFSEPLPVLARYAIAIFNNLLFAALLAQVVAKQKAMLIELAQTDELTGCLNRKALIPDLQNTIDDFHRSQINSVILLIDIDHFKSINDTYGHQSGDRVLQHFAAHLKHKVPPAARVYRYGGEEFLILLRDCSVTRAINIAQPLLQMPKSEAPESPPLTVTCSIGLAAFCRGISLDFWLKHADIALYEAKSLGRNRLELIDPKHIQLSSDQLT
ncbi:GGDEF domain-containing protein [Shewanella sp. GXUN23E]|uniref:GGDEF domain-containing protein n=1 Tax=Shewanella sp. GXUN23E TaxID=3422498 RepID=UPI003D7DADAC